MRLTGELISEARTLEGDRTITLVISEDKDLTELHNKKVTLDIDKYKGHRSLNANAYLWVLCTEIAKVLGSDKDTIYLRQLFKYGVFQDVIIKREAIEAFSKVVKYLQILDEYDTSDVVTARCYFGSSGYDTKEMSVLIDGTVQDAKEIGIDTWSQEEIDNLIKNWGGANEKN